MEINLNKVANTETSEFINFSIREYVAKIRSKDPRKCWPFGSLRDPNENEVFTSYKSTESRFLSTQTQPSNINGSIDKPEHTVPPNSRKGEINNGKKDMVESLGNDDNLGKVVYNEFLESTSSNENSVNEVAKNTQSVAVENHELETNRLKRKPQKFRLLSDLLKDPASRLIRARCGITNPENVNKRFFTETEDELDDNVTLDVLFRKPKGVQVTDMTLKNKKKKTIRVEKSSVDHDIKSKHGSKDSAEKVLQIAPRIRSRKRVRNDDNVDKQAMVKGQKDCGLPLSQQMNRYTEVSYAKVTKTANEDSEMEAVMLLARHFNDVNPLTNERILSGLKSNTSCACAQKKIKNSPNESAPKLILTKSSKNVSKNFQAGDHLKGTTACVEICYTKAAAVMREIVCSVNKNPADFSSPNAENMFMRGA